MLKAVHQHRTSSDSAMSQHLPAAGPEATSDQDHWFENAIVYHVVTDRFSQGDPSRAPLFDRQRDATGPGGFHGGDFAGVTGRIVSGWFGALGVNCIWLSAPYEQIHGWVPGGGGSYRHHPYHGYWALDYTTVEPSFGTREEFREMVDAAHERGIRIVLDVGLSHPGYPDLYTLQELLPGTVNPAWEDAQPHRYADFFNHDDPAFAQWWGKDWVCADLPGYQALGNTPYDGLLHGLPRFRLDDERQVSPPDFLLAKPGSRVTQLAGKTVRGYLVTWLADWVREFGIDGFRCDSASHVGMAAWSELKLAASRALLEWKEQHPHKAVDRAPFWMTGEVFGHNTQRNEYFDHGFDSLINFSFQDELKAILRDVREGHRYSLALAHFRLNRVYQAYADGFATGGHNVLSYISSHDVGLFDRAQLVQAGTALLLLPGAVQILYGDETGRAPGEDGTALCSDMNWGEIDVAVMARWSMVGRFRARHRAIAQGVHALRSEVPYAFSRLHARSADRVLIVLGPASEAEIQVSDLWADGTVLTDGANGGRFEVSEGCIRVSTDSLLLLAGPDDEAEHPCGS